ncbi:hypothetical protein HYPSUDRAFT_294615 [Hypholoma sublateritium FD-334 SS-4]|uniref:Uncharacterized protein n=1 Tax=Hypholoma sublateritium (strain FD-334 SS-4) TaxID=945553 RepID=A0A0D2KP51_HYPSF|nr:hypothetical protein HYPSUDRAFT_294615 [Hypholoma sublateritium FD-334 SS-4]
MIFRSTSCFVAFSVPLLALFLNTLVAAASRIFHNHTYTYFRITAQIVEGQRI